MCTCYIHRGLPCQVHLRMARSVTNYVKKERKKTLQELLARR